MQFLQAVPNETSEFAEFQELAQLTADFETSLGRASLIPDWKETEGDKLRRFSTDVELHFAVKKRKQVVAKARNLLVASDYKTFLVIMLHKLVLGKNLFISGCIQSPTVIDFVMMMLWYLWDLTSIHVVLHSTKLFMCLSSQVVNLININNMHLCL